MGLRKEVISSGFYLTARQALGAFFTLLNILLVIRVIGPGPYGIFALGNAVSGFVTQLLGMGMGVYILRQGLAEVQTLHQVFSFLLLTGALAAFLAPILASLVQYFAHLPPEAWEPLWILFSLVPLQLLSIAPQAHIEHRLDFKRAVMAELVGQIAALLVAVPLAMTGKGIWAPIAAAWAQQVTTLALYWRLSGYQPQFLWNPTLLGKMLGYGLTYSVSMWVWQLRTPLVLTLVNRALGAEVAGNLALTLRVVEFLAFPKAIAWRISIPTFARLIPNRESLLKALEEGTLLQVFALGPIFLFFSLTSSFFPSLLGASWTGMVDFFPYVAIAYLFNAHFSLHSAILYVLGCNFCVFVFHVAHNFLLAGGLFLFLNQWGATGYGLAEITALFSYGVVHMVLVKRVGRIQYAVSLPWTTFFAIAYFHTVLGYWALAPLVLSFTSSRLRSSWAILGRQLALLFKKPTH